MKGKVCWSIKSSWKIFQMRILLKPKIYHHALITQKCEYFKHILQQHETTSSHDNRKKSQNFSEILKVKRNFSQLPSVFFFVLLKQLFREVRFCSNNCYYQFLSFFCSQLCLSWDFWKGKKMFNGWSFYLFLYLIFHKRDSRGLFHWFFESECEIIIGGKNWDSND